MDVISWSFLFICVNGTPFVRRSSDIWVTGCFHVESVIFQRKRANRYIHSSEIWGYRNGDFGFDAVHFGRTVLRFQRNLQLQSLELTFWRMFEVSLKRYYISTRLVGVEYGETAGDCPWSRQSDSTCNASGFCPGVSPFHVPTEKQRKLIEVLNDIPQHLLENSETVPQLQCDPFVTLLISRIVLYICAV
jgi:hypothetical protein